MTHRRTLAAVAVVVAAALLAACSGSDEPDGSRGAAVDVPAALDAIATEIIVPAYERLGDELADLDSAVTALCATPSVDALDDARDAWRRSIGAWQETRAVGVGPAMDARLMSDLAFPARAGNIETSLSGPDPVDRAAIAERGAAVRGLYALEVALFDPPSDTLVTAEGARRCTYAASVASLSAEAATPVVQAWADGSAAERLVAGLDGGPRSSSSALVNEISRRLQEIDQRGLRDVAASETIEDVPEGRLDGPAAHRLAGLRALAAGVAAAIGERSAGIVALIPDDDGLARRLLAARDRMDETMAVLPDSIAASFDDRDAVAEAADAVADLQVLVSTELAAELGVTISFSDSDGDA